MVQPPSAEKAVLALAVMGKPEVGETSSNQESWNVVNEISDGACLLRCIARGDSHSFPLSRPTSVHRWITTYPPLPTSSCFKFFPRVKVNLGKGYLHTLRPAIQRIRSRSWTFSASISLNQNRLLHLAGPPAFAIRGEVTAKQFCNNFDTRVLV